MKVTIWHNKQCSTSRKVLAYLESKSLDIIIRDYIAQPPSVAELEDVLSKMDEKAPYILRKKDKVYKEKFAESKFTDAQWLKVMSENPSIIERPIVIVNDKSYLARPVDEFIMEFEGDY